MAGRFPETKECRRVERVGRGTAAHIAKRMHLGDDSNITGNEEMRGKGATLFNVDDFFDDCEVQNVAKPGKHCIPLEGRRGNYWLQERVGIIDHDDNNNCWHLSSVTSSFMVVHGFY